MRLTFKLLNSINNYFSYIAVTMTTFNLTYKTNQPSVCAHKLLAATANLILRDSDCFSEVSSEHLK